MFGTKDLKSVWDSIAGFGFVFEVGNDPSDASQYSDQSKSIEIWLLAFTERDDAALMRMSLQQLMAHKHIVYVGSITASTPIDSRRWAVSTLDKGWAYVLAAPTVEWEKFYLHRLYPPVPISAGHRGNFVVSLPPRIDDIANSGTKSSGLIPPGNLHL